MEPMIPTTYPYIIVDTRFSREVTSDCDCPRTTTSTVKIIDPDLESLPFTLQLHPDLESIILDDEHTVIFVPSANSVAVLNQSAMRILNSFKATVSHILITQRFMSEYDNVNHIIVQLFQLQFLVEEIPLLQNLISMEDHTLTAWLHITDRCNLRCSYCYLRHERIDMSLETGFGALDSAMRSALSNRYKRLKIKYAGGEAMIRFPFIFRLHEYARALADRHHIELEGVILSNGTLLTKKIIKKMQLHGLGLMISLDGLGKFHDVQRHYATGRGTSHDVMNSIELAIANNLIPDISITVGGQNIDGLPELLQWILQRELPFSINFYRENELSASNTNLRFEEENIISSMLAAFAVIEENLPPYTLLTSIIDRANLSSSHQIACTAGRSYLVFDHLGQVSKCQMQMNHVVTNFQSIDPLLQVRQDKLGIQNISVDEKEGCRSCKWKYWCAGGCTLATYRATGRYDIKSPNCRIYQTLYPEVVRLEGLRLLKYVECIR